MKKMKKRCRLRITAISMLAAGILFVGYALCHPEASFPWNPRITYMLYAVYAAVTTVLLIASIRKD